MLAELCFTDGKENITKQSMLEIVRLIGKENYILSDSITTSC